MKPATESLLDHPLSADQAQRHSQFALLRERRFWPLFVTQFLGAFNDNAYKNALVVLLTFNVTAWTTMKPEVLTNLAAGLFILPFFLFSATAGQLADKFDKARLARWVKVLEVLIILVAALGFWLHSLAVLLAALGMLGLQSTFFGPVKYAILPQHLRTEELVGGNAIVDSGTFVAILLGTIGGGLLAQLDSGIAWIISICSAVAITGFWSSCHIPAAPAPTPELKISWNLWIETLRCMGFARRERSVFFSILGISWFWLYGIVVTAQFPVYGKAVLGGDEGSFTLLLAVFCIGIGIGSLLCEKLTHIQGRAIEPGLVPIGALGMVIFGADLAFAAPMRASGVALPVAQLLHHGSTWRVLFDLLMLSSFGGLYCVPLYALMQQRSAPACRARVIAANNILNSLFMTLGALAAGAFLGLCHGAIPSLFLWLAVAHAGVTVYIFSVAPEFFTRALVWLGIRRELK